MTCRKASCAVFLFLLACVGCGDPVFPGKGTAGTILVADIPRSPYEGAEMKIGFNSQAEWQKLKERVPNPPVQSEVLVSGRVVADPTQPLGYYLDPATTSVPDGTFPEAIYSMREVTERMDQWAGYDVYVILRVKVEKYL